MLGAQQRSSDQLITVSLMYSMLQMVQMSSPSFELETDELSWLLGLRFLIHFCVDWHGAELSDAVGFHLLQVQVFDCLGGREAGQKEQWCSRKRRTV